MRSHVHVSVVGRILLTLSLLVCLASRAIAADAPPTTPPTTQPASAHPMKFTVVDAKTNQPVPGVTLKLSGYHGRESIKGEARTDDAGVATLSIAAKEVRYLSVSLRKDGFVPMRASWPARGENTQKNTLPDTFIFPLEPGTKISGRVLDDAGAPVNGATIKLELKKKFDDPHVGTDVYGASAKTDAQGVWTYDRVPAEFEEVGLCAWHHQYATERGYYHTQPFADVAKLRDGSAQLTLVRGVQVAGTVFGSDGEPLKDAQVGVGADRFPSNVLPAQKTDENGKFSVGWKPGELLVLTVKAKGHAPELQQLTPPSSVAPDMKPLEFRLQPGKTLKVRVTDIAGKPLANVGASADTWRGCRTLDASFRTDKDGRFEWKDAPTDPVMFDIYTMGYADQRNTPITAGDDEVVIKLSKPLKVAGTVVDAKTNEPIKAFDVIPGITFDDQRISWQRRNDQLKGANGKFETEQSYPYPGYAFRIEAPGYIPADSKIVRMSDGEVKLEFKLEKGSGLGGVVKDWDGKPVAGAKVIVATPDQTAYIRNGIDVNDQGNTQAETDAEGKYSLPPLTGIYTIVYASKAGYAELEKATAEAVGGDVKLTPWARIEGTVLISGKPAPPDNDISAFLRDEKFDEKAPRIYHQIDAKTDPAGKFVIERVRPGSYGVNRTIRVPMSASSWMNPSTHTARVTVKPGETATVQLGGTGQPVVGRVAIPPELAAVSGWRFTEATLRTSFPKPPDIPENVKGMSADQRKAWQEQWVKSDVYKAYEAAQKKASDDHRSYALVMQPSGQFRADDVPAGEYTLTIQASKPDPNGSCGPGDALATAASTVTLPPIPGGAARSDDPFDVGTLPMRVTRTLGVGDAAPAFAIKTLDGKDLKLADLKGKYVVLDFWATWCGPCVAEVPNLKAAYESFAAHPDFVMVSLSLDEKTEAPLKFVEKEGLKWHQGFLGEWSKTTLPEEYGVRGIPAVFLIGPDGRILAKNLRGASLKAELAKHLRNTQAGG